MVVKPTHAPKETLFTVGTPLTVTFCEIVEEQLLLDVIVTCAVCVPVDVNVNVEVAAFGVVAVPFDELHK